MRCTRYVIRVIDGRYILCGTISRRGRYQKDTQGRHVTKNFRNARSWPSADAARKEAQETDSVLPVSCMLDGTPIGILADTKENRRLIGWQNT